MNIEHYIHPMLAYFHQHPFLGELLTFIIAFLEALPIIGTIVPGSVTMTFIGILAGTGSLSVTLTFWMAVFGAYCGDCIGFGFGHHFQDRIKTMWPFHKHPHWLTRGRGFIDRHGAKSIIIGRFVGPIRSTVPMIAGILHMRWTFFLLAAIPACIAWAILYMGPGIVLGNVAADIPKAAMGRFLLIGLGVLLSVWLVCWLLTKLVKLSGQALQQCLSRFYHYHLNQHGLRQRVMHSLRVPGQSQSARRFILACAAATALLLFLMLFMLIVTQNRLLVVNAPVFAFTQSIRGPNLHLTAVLLSTFFAPIALLLLGVVMAGYFAWHKQWRHAGYLVLTMVLTVIGITLCRHLFFSHRPDGLLLQKTTSSFPSGHITTLTSTLGLLCYYVSRRYLPQRQVFCCTFSLLVLVCAIARIMTGQHWLTDTVGGALLGGAILSAVITAIERRPLPALKSSALVTLLFSMTLISGTYSFLHTQEDMLHTQRHHPIITLTPQQWWQANSNPLPDFRTNRFGYPIQPFNLQWLGSRAAITSWLQQHGFHPVTSTTLIKNALSHLVTKKHYQPPLVPAEHLTQHAAVYMIKMMPDHHTVLELSLWQSRYQLDNAPTLWIGHLAYYLNQHDQLMPSRYQDLRLSRDGVSVLNQLTPLLKRNHYTIQQTKVDQTKKKIINMNWQGDILLINSSPP